MREGKGVGRNDRFHRKTRRKMLGIYREDCGKGEGREEASDEQKHAFDFSMLPPAPFDPYSSEF